MPPNEDEESPLEPAAVAALHAAAAAGDVATVQSILRSGQCPAHAQEEVEGVSALMLAAGGGHGECVHELLVAGAPWNAIDRRGRCAGNHALDAGHQRIVDALVDAAVRAELLLGAAQRGTQLAAAKAAESDEYLSRNVRYEGDTLFDEANDGVMMEWERPLMEAHARQLCAGGDKDVLNVGFGMGIIDGAIAGLGPRSHTIIEAHPGVLAKMRADGWHAKPRTRVCEGRWQQALPALLAEGVQFDGIYFDTYGEHDSDMQDFHALLPKLLRPNGIYSFFNGLCPFNVFFQGVACSVVQLELLSHGLSTSFAPMPIATPGGEDPAWAGVTRRYFQADTYYFPTCVFDGGASYAAGESAGANASGGGGGGGGGDDDDDDALMDEEMEADEGTAVGGGDGEEEEGGGGGGGGGGGVASQLIRLNRGVVRLLGRSLSQPEPALREMLREGVLPHFEEAGWRLDAPLASLWAAAEERATAAAADMEAAGESLPSSFIESALPSRTAFTSSLELPHASRIAAERAARDAAALVRDVSVVTAPLDANSARVVRAAVRVATRLLGGAMQAALEGREEEDEGMDEELRIALVANPLAEDGEGGGEGGGAGGGEGGGGEGGGGEGGGGDGGGAHIGGKDSDQRQFASAEELFASGSGGASPAAWYGTSAAYWASVAADVDGMLGGLGELHGVDVDASLGFIDDLRRGLEGEVGVGAPQERGAPPPLPADGVALDCGAGIGRVSRCVLLERFRAVELLEPSRAFLDRARAELPADRVNALHEAPLQGFEPPAAGRYAVVWVQWVLNYLKDADLTAFLRTCATALAPGGRLILKESVSKEDNGFYVDRSDASITRTDSHFRQIFAAAGLHVAACRLQPGMPKGVFRVWMYSLRPKDQPCE